MGEGTSSTLNLFRRYFWKPPRAHGDVIEDRSVSFLELFYDLVSVVVIARAAHTLAEHVLWRGVAIRRPQVRGDLHLRDTPSRRLS